MKPRLPLPLIVCVALLPAAEGRIAAADLQWEEQAGSSLALRDVDSVIWQFNYGPDLAKPFFHPLALPDSSPLTVDRPADHAWHHGLWFSWVFINGVNYWEHDPQLGRPRGRTAWSEVQIERGSNYSAHIAMNVQYAVDDEPVALTERRVLKLTPPSEEGAYVIDWCSVFAAGDRPVTLSVTPIPPAAGGVAWGGYGGLSLRLAAGLEDRRASSAEAVAEFDASGIYRTSSVACDYSGVLGPVTAGIAILDHQSNPRHPSPWYAIRSDMSYLNPAFMASGPLDLGPHESASLTYRIIVHGGRWDAAALTQAALQFNQESTAK